MDCWRREVSRAGVLGIVSTMKAMLAAIIMGLSAVFGGPYHRW